MDQNHKRKSSGGNSFPNIDKIQYGSSALLGGTSKSSTPKRSSSHITSKKSTVGSDKQKNGTPVLNENIQKKSKTAHGTQPTATKARTSKSASSQPVRKTKEQLEEEKRIRIEQKRKAEIAQRRRKEQERIEKERRAKEFSLFLKKASAFMSNVFVGAAVALVISLVVTLIYSRVITTYDLEVASTRYSFYTYIDPEDETKAAEKKRELRENGKESAKVIFKKKHKVVDNVAYLPIFPLADLFSLSISGDGSVRTVYISDSKSSVFEQDSVVFTNGAKDIIVNGSIHTLKNAPIFDGGDVYVPFEFFERFIVGLSYKEEKGFRSKTIKIILDEPKISFKGSAESSLDVPKVQDYITTAESEYTYSFDLTPYEQYINPSDPNKYLALINVNNRLESNYEPSDLIDVIYTRKSRKVKERMRLDAAKALEAFLGTASAEGFSDVSVTSGYRTYEYQNQLFTGRVNQKMASGTYTSKAQAEAETAKFTMYPGASEHQSGLCVDMHNQPSALQSFAETEAYSWMYKHCADFGFILRYPQNKEDITGVSFEPWHFRFVGRYHAQRIMESGLCLEEYIQTLNEDS